MSYDVALTGSACPLRVDCSAAGSRTLREAFPMLQTSVKGKPLIYLNSAATALKPQCVIDAMTEYYQTYGVNIARGVDEISYRATKTFEETRHKTANFLHAARSEEIIFTRGTTASLNLVCRSFAETVVSAGDEIIVSSGEHHANYIPWQQLARKVGAKFTVLPLDANGCVAPDTLAAAISDRTKIVAVFHISNVMGACNDLTALAAIAHAHGAYFIADGAQGIVHEQIDVQRTGVDFYAFSGHKLFGPTGIGVLYGKYDLLEQMEPIEYGGEMIDVVDVYTTTFAAPPHRFEAGTMPIAEVIGLGKAIDFVQATGYPLMQARVAALTDYLFKGLQAKPSISLYNPHNLAGGIASFNVSGIHPHDVAGIYDRAGISVRAGQHCSQPMMRALHQQATLRVSLGFYNTFEEIDRFLEITTEAGDFLDVLFG